MIHLTVTGPYAGLPLCNVNKQDALTKGDQFYHAMYFNDWDNSDLCHDCKKEWQIEDENIIPDEPYTKPDRFIDWPFG